MKTIEIKQKLVEEALDQLKAAQQDGAEINFTRTLLKS